MTKKAEQLRMPHSCSHCNDPVAPRRPSANGDHFCARPECQAAKQRLYHHRRRAALERKLDTVDVADNARREFIWIAMHRPRQECPACGLPNGVGGYAHRAGPGIDKPCVGLGGLGRDVGPKWLDVAHPHLAPGFNADRDGHDLIPPPAEDF